MEGRKEGRKGNEKRRQKKRKEKRYDETQEPYSCPNSTKSELICFSKGIVSNIYKRG